MNQREDVDNLAVPLDTLLVDAGLSPWRRFLPNSSTAKVALNLLRQPSTLALRARHVAAEMGRVAVGISTVAPSSRDRRFEDPAWRTNPLLRRVA